MTTPDEQREWTPVEEGERIGKPPTALQVLFAIALPQLIDAAQPLAHVLCGLCADPRVGRAWHHAHEPEGLHFHHCIDPGDGLPSACTASTLFVRLYQALALELVGRDGAGRAQVVEEIELEPRTSALGDEEWTP